MNRANEEQSRLLAQNFHLQKHRISKNRLLLVSSLNVITLLCAIFSMAYYKWVLITIATSSGFNRQVEHTVAVWCNLLYVNSEQEGYVLYESAQNMFCDEDDFYCRAIFYELQFVGQLCFGIFSLACLIETYDFYHLLKYLLGNIKETFFSHDDSDSYRSNLKAKNNLRNMVMVLTYIVGLSLNVFSISILDIAEYQFGISFWIFLASLTAFVLIIIWENRTMAKMVKQDLVLNLIEKEKQMQQQEQVDNESMSSTFSV